jgi:uncharacterized Rossmann fold enzyme
MQTLPYLVNRFGDRYLYDVNRNAFNQTGAETLFRRRYGESLLDKDSLTIIIGTDSGLLVRHVMQAGVPEGSRFLFYELDHLLPTIEAETQDLTLDEHVTLAGERDLKDLLQDIDFSDYANLGAIRLIESIGASDDFIGAYHALVSRIRQQLDAILWVHNCQLSNPSFVRRQLENLVEQHVPASALENLFDGGTAVLLGGGPSLDELLPWVREHQTEITILAVSRICRRLREADVVPHLVVSIDPTELSFDISKELLELNPQVVFAHANHVAFPLLAQWRGRSVFMDRRYPWTGADEQPNLGSAGPTVTNTALGLAIAMGFKRIVLGGIDLCHSAEGYSHARGSNERDAGPMFGMASIRVETNTGGQAETTPDFFNAITAFGAQATNAYQQGIEVINPAPGAAVIDGVKHVALAELDVVASNGNIFALLHARIDQHPAAQRGNNLAAMRRELARAHNEVRGIIKLAEQALACNDGLFGRDGRQADFVHKRRMDRIERQIDRRHGDLAEIVKMFSARAFLHMPPSDREWTDDEIEQAGRTYYTAYRDNAQSILALIEAAQKRIDVAAEELRDTPDFDRLIAQWEADRVPGRARAWLHRNGLNPSDLPPSVQPRFEALDQDFIAILAERDTGHARKMRNEAALGPVRGKLQLLFREKNTAALENIAGQLKKQNTTEAKQLGVLARGYLAEIDADAEAAFAEYSNLIDLAGEQMRADGEEQANPRLEDALRRMVVIAIDKHWHEQALLILQTLAGMSPAYQPQYADMLRLSGDMLGAVDVYTHYLARVPADHQAMLRLGKLYQSIGALDSAKTAFNYILEQDPENKAAKTLLRDIDNAA